MRLKLPPVTYLRHRCVSDPVRAPRTPLRIRARLFGGFRVSTDKPRMTYTAATAAAAALLRPIISDLFLRWHREGAQPGFFLSGWESKNISCIFRHDVNMKSQQLGRGYPLENFLVGFGHDWGSVPETPLAGTVGRCANIST